MTRLPSSRIVAAFAAGVAAVALARYAVREDAPGLLFRVAARAALGPALGRERTAALVRSAERRYASLAAAPHEARTRPGRFYLRLAAFLLALERALVDSGTPVADADAMLSDAFFRVMRVSWIFPDAVLRARHPRDAIARARARQRLARRSVFVDPDFAMREVAVEGGYGLDVERCVLAEYYAARGASVFGERVMCAQDLLMARARGERLERAGTLCGGAERCAFRFLPNVN